MAKGKYDENTINYILNEKNKNSTELSIELGIPATTIRSIRQKNGFKSNKVFQKDLLTEELCEEIYKKCLEGIAFTELSKEYNIDRKVIAKKIKEKYNFESKLHKKIFSDDEENQIFNECLNNTTINLAKKYNCSVSLIQKIYQKYCNKETIGNKIYEYENYFNTIDTYEKAYWLGIIASDGCVYKRNNGQKLLSISLQKNDKYLLKNFYKSINKNKATFIYEKDNFANIQIGSKTMYNSLSNYNIIPRKTWVYKPIMLEDRLFFSYLRGYFDGDGTIIIKNQNDSLPSSYRVSICGNKYTVEVFSNFLNKYNIDNSIQKDNREEKYTSDFYDIRINNAPSMYLFLKYIYNDKTDYTYLHRKYEKAKKFIDLIENNIDNYKKYDLCVEEFKNCPLFK